MLRRKPEEVLGMWSDALRILDENTMKLYVEELEEKLQKTLEEKEQEKMRAEEKFRQITKEKAKEFIIKENVGVSKFRVFVFIRYRKRQKASAE